MLPYCIYLGRGGGVGGLCVCTVKKTGIFT